MHVEIWSDIACPWCYVGKRRFEAALATFEHRDAVRVTWRSFELDPGAPAAREHSGAEHLAEKYGMSVEEARARQAQMAEMAAGDGLDMRADRPAAATRSTATGCLPARRPARPAGRDEGAPDARLPHRGRAGHDHDTLCGSPPRSASRPPRCARRSRATASPPRSARTSRPPPRSGISAVPCFVIDRRFGAPGAQPPEVLSAFLQRGWDARSPLEVVASGDACGPDGC